MSSIDGFELIEKRNVKLVDTQAATMLDDDAQVEYKRIRDNRVLRKELEVRNLITEMLSSGKYGEADSIYDHYQLYFHNYNYTRDIRRSFLKHF